MVSVCDGQSRNRGINSSVTNVLHRTRAWLTPWEAAEELSQRYTQPVSAAEDFCYSLQNLKRALVVGETTGGGAHSSRGPQRLTPSFTAVIPVGRSVSPITKTNWEGTGVTPDIKTSADTSLSVAHLHALRFLLENETDRQWKQTLQQIAGDLSKSVSVPAPQRQHLTKASGVGSIISCR